MQSRNRRRENRWWQLVLGVVLMFMISSPQYVWTLFVGPIQEELGAGLATVQVTFSLLIVLQTWLSPIQGFLVEKLGPRLLFTIGGLLVGGSWVFASMVESVAGLYLTYGALGGIGTGIVYVGVIGLMVRWFPDRRGLATGLAAAGYGAGAILFTLPVNGMIESAGYGVTLLVFGLVQGIVIVVATQIVRVPPTGWTPEGYDPNRRVRSGFQSARNYAPREMLRTPMFWLLFAMMTMLSTGGLMITSQVGPFAEDFGVADEVVLGVQALALSLVLSRVTNGVTRPFFGWVSDHIGRENTMGIAFTLEAFAIIALLMVGDNPVLFVLLTGLAFFAWGEIFSLFPSTLTDIFGTRHATTNYGFLYIAQGVGSLLGGPLAALLYSVTGSWSPVFIIVVVLDLTTAGLALMVLKPMRVRWIQDSPAVADVTSRTVR